MTIGVIGAGAFGTALAITWGKADAKVTLWGRDADAMQTSQRTRTTPRLPKATLPDTVTCTGDLHSALVPSIIALALPAQSLRPFLLAEQAKLAGKHLIACCKGIDLETMTGPLSTITDTVPNSAAAMLTGPSFAADIAGGLPTALTLACADDTAGEALQTTLATQTLRIYRTTDTIGAGLGDSARAALMTRGFTEMAALATRLGAEKETLMGLSGFGDLVLTCTSTQSRNFRYGVALGEGATFDGSTTVEGAATAKSVVKLAQSLALDMPICTVVGHLIDNKTTVPAALETLMGRPLKEE